MESRTAKLMKSPHVRFLLLFAAFGFGYYLYSVAIFAEYGHTKNFPPHPAIKIASLVAFVVATQRIYADRFFPRKTN